jgi:hypothetical protein
VRRREGADRLAVEDDVVGGDAEPRERAPDGERRGVVDVEALDLADGSGAEGKGDGTVPDAGRQPLPLGWGELLRVVDAADGAGVGWHDDGASDDGARERAPSDFVDAGDQRAVALT